MKNFLLKEGVLILFLFTTLTLLSFFEIEILGIKQNHLHLIIFCFTVLIYWFLSKKDLEFNFNQPFHYFFSIFIGALGLFLFIESLGMIIQLTVFKYEEMFYVKYKRLGFEIFESLLVYPLIEELFFRKIILGKLITLFKSKKALIISSIIFTIFHLYGQVNLTYVFLTGISLGYLYMKTNSFGLIFIGHSLLNFLGLIYTINLKYIDSKIDSFKLNIWILFLIIGLFLFYLSHRLLKNNGRLYV